MSRRLLPVATGMVLLAVGGCTTGKVRSEDRLVFQYAEGVQSLHQPAYESLYSACHPERASASIKDRIQEYEATRRRGTVVFSPDGVEIIKLSALGRGAYFKVNGIRRRGGLLEFDSLVKPDYQSIQYTEFPEGAVLYLLGEPLGAVTAVRPGGKVAGPHRKLVESVNLHWKWLYQGGAGSEERWCLDSVLPEPRTAVFREFEFREVAAGPEPVGPPPIPPGGVN